MTLISNTYQGTDGVNLTAATSGGASGDAYQIVNPSNTDALEYYAAVSNPVTGLSSVGKFDASLNTSTFIAEVRFVQAGAIRGAQQWVVKFTGAPTASTCVLMQIRGTLQNGDLRVSTGGIIHLNLNGQLVGLSGGTPVDMSPSSPWYVIDFWLEEGTTSSNGRAKYRVRALTDLTTTLVSGDTGNASNTGVQGTDVITDWRIGKFTGAATMPVFYTAQHRANDGATDYLSDPSVYNSSTPPTIVNSAVLTGTGAQCSDTQSFTVSVPAGTQDGDVLIATVVSFTSSGESYAWSVSPVTPASWTAIGSRTVAGTLVYQVWAAPYGAGLNRNFIGNLSTGRRVLPTSLTVRDAGSIGNWILGSVSTRATNGTATTTVATSITSTVDNTLILGIFGERTSAAETDVSGVSGATKYAYLYDSSYASIETVTYTQETLATPQASGDTTVTYINSQTSNGAGQLIGIVPTSLVSAGADQADIEPWTTVTLAGTGTGSWSQVSGASVTLSGSGAIRTFTAPPSLSAQTLVFDYGGDQVSIGILPATEAMYSGGQWVPVRLIRQP